MKTENKDVKKNAQQEDKKETYNMVVELVKFLNLANTKGAYNLQESAHVGTIANQLLEKYKE